MNAEHLVLKGIAIKEHLAAAERAFDTHFATPVKEWLSSKPDYTADVMGIAKPKLVTSKDKTQLDDARMMEDLRDLVKANLVSAEELKKMVLDGTFALAVPEAMVLELAKRMKKAPESYTILVKGKPGFSLRWDGINNSKPRIAEHYLRLGDIEEKVVDAATDELDEETIKKMKGV
jgi:hypothetical protein